MAATRGSPLLSSVEALFENTESIVIAAFQAQKISHNADSTGSQLLKALGAKVLARDVLRPAVIIFTVKRSLTDRGFLPSIHFARPLQLVQAASSDGGGGKLELRKTFPLKTLHDVRITSFARSAAAAAAAAAAGRSPASSPATSGAGSKSAGRQQQQGDLQQQQVVEVRCASHHNLPEHRGQYVLPDVEAANFMVSLALQLLRQQDAVLPSVSGIPIERLDAWWSSHREEVTQALSSFALEVVTPGTIVVGRSGDDQGCVLVSDKEASELEELLALFKLGLGETEQFAAALQEEAAALEAANVYAMLENTPLVDGVITDLRRTQSILDDLDESLKVFDFKLRHMRDDIAAIEASNNSLECQARQNSALLVLLEKLLGSLDLDSGLVSILERPAFDPYKLSSVVSAAWQLHSRRLKLSGELEDGLSPTLTHMRVVKEAQQHLDDLTARFVGKVLTFLTGLLSQLVGEALADAGGGTQAGGRYDRARKVCAPSHAALHTSLRRYTPLIQVMAALEPQALSQLQQQVCQELNGLLRRELRLAAGELRRAATAELASSGSAGEGDYTMSRDRSSSTASGSKRGIRLSTGGGGAGAGSSVGGSDSIDELGMDPADFPGAAAQGASAAKRTSFLEGLSSGIPLHEAWALLLNGFIPLMAQEAHTVADLLIMYSGDEDRLRQGPLTAAATSAGGASPDSQQQQQQQQQSPQAARRGSISSQAIPLPRGPDVALTYAGVKCMQQLLSGMEGEFTALTELTLRSHQVMMLPMLAVTRGWQSALANQAPAAPLSTLLSQLNDRLGQQWITFGNMQLASVEQYEGRSKMGLQQGIKHLHVFPFVSQFCLMAHDMEVGLAEGLAAVTAAASYSSSSSSKHATADEEQQQQQAGEGEQQSAAAAAAGTVRHDADMLYHNLLPVVLSRVERLAASDAKYSERCRLENYCFMGEALKSLALRLPALQQHWQVAESRRESALSSYVQDQLEYSKLWKMLEFGNKLDNLLKVVSPPEVSFQKDCSASEVRSLMRSTMDGVDKKLEAMAARVRKHLGHGPLFSMVWGTLKSSLLARYEHLESLMEQCYPTTPLRPSPEELRELFRATSAG